MEFRKVFYINCGVDSIEKRFVYDGKGEYFDIEEERTLTEEDLREEGLYLTEEEALEVYENMEWDEE